MMIYFKFNDYSIFNADGHLQHLDPPFPLFDPLMFSPFSPFPLRRPPCTPLSASICLWYCSCCARVALDV